MAPQPQPTTTRQDDIPAHLIHAENQEAIVGAADDVLSDGSTQALDQNPDGEEPSRRREEAPARSPSDDMRSSIAKRFRREEPENERPFNGDMADGENLYGDVAREGELSDEEYDADAAAAEVGEPQPRRQEPQAQPQTRKLKVRGQDVELTDEQILEAARKTLAADTYLDEAKALLKEAKEIRRGRTTQDRQPHDDLSAQDEELDLLDPPESDQPQEPTFQDVVRKIQYGDPEEAAADLERIVAKSSDKASTEGALRRAFDQDLARSQKQLKEFSEANPTLAADKRSAQAIEAGMYDLYLEDIKALGIDESKIPTTPKELANWHRFYRVHGYEVRSTKDLLNKSKEDLLKWRNGGQQPARQQQSSRQAPPNVRVNVNRDDRRMAIPVQPNRSVSPRRDAPPAPTGSDVVANMRRARGQT